MPIKIFIGYDKREDIAYEVCKYSILKHASKPVEIIPLKLDELRKQDLYWRKEITNGSTRVDSLDGLNFSTDFSFSRWLVCYLAAYKGQGGLYIDCDFVFDSDISDLWKHYDDRLPVSVVKHKYNPTETSKMDGIPQSQYRRKNWSSLVLWNFEHPKNKILTPQLVNTVPGSYLHQFQWLEDDEIGEIPYQWNYLEGHYKTNDALAVHYTRGGPWFAAYHDCDYSDTWRAYYREYMEEKNAGN